MKSYEDLALGNLKIYMRPKFSQLLSPNSLNLTPTNHQIVCDFRHRGAMAMGNGQ